MTNLEWIRTLSEEEFADWLYDEWLHHLQYRWSSSRGGLIIWLKDRKTEPSFKVDGIGDNDPTIHAIAYLQKVGWLQEHDRALTEPSNSEIPNNCEHITEDGVTCAKYPACDDCLDNPLNKVKGSERLLKGLRRASDD